MALAMFSTAMVMKPSATSSALLPGLVLRQGAELFAHGVDVERLVLAGAEDGGKKSGCSLPSMTLASVTVSGPPRR
jgi:hypothetical protein